MSMLDDWYEDEYGNSYEDDPEAGPRVVGIALICILVFILGVIFTLIFIH